MFFFFFNPKRSAADRFFLLIEEKIELYNRHIAVTKSLYNDERTKELKPLIDEYNSVKDEVEKIYEDEYKNWEGEEDQRALMAEHLSGRQNMYDYFESQEDIVNEHYDEMFDYFNKSSLIILYALLEGELKKLCGTLKPMAEIRIDVDDFKSDNYIEGYIKYLDLVIGLKTEKLETFTNRIQQIQYVRNRIAHNGAEFTMAANSALDECINKSGGLLVLAHDSEMEKRQLKMSNPEYIDKCYELVRKVFNALFWLVNERFGNTILKERIRYMFEPEFGETAVEIQKTETIKGGMCFTVRIGYAEEQGTAAEFICKISVTGAKTNSVSVINQDEGNQRLQKWSDERQSKGHKLYDGFLKGLIGHKSGLKVDLKLYQSS
jgi:hypothetical protein